MPPKNSRKSKADPIDLEDAEFSGIRPYEEKDKKGVNMILGLSTMEGLASANSQTYWHPLVLLLWASCSLALDYRIGWWPQADVWWSPATVVVGFAGLAVPIMILVEFFNRSYFETLMRRVIGSKDIVDISAYYTTSSSSPNSCVVLRHRGEILGVCAIDAKHPGEKLELMIAETNSKDKPFDLNYAKEWIGLGADKKSKKSAEENKLASEKESIEQAEKDAERETSRREGLRSRKGAAATTAATEEKKFSTAARHTAEIRHLHVDFPYRLKGVGTDLLNAALSQTFAANSSIDNVIVEEKFWTIPGGKQFVSKRGFKPVSKEEAKKNGWRKIESSRVMGIRHAGRWWRLRKEDWQGPRKEGDDALGSK